MPFAVTSRARLRYAVENTFGVVPVGSSGTITNATNAAPIVVTSAAHGLATGAVITITAVVGNTNANNTWMVNVVDANTFNLIGSQGNAAYTSGGSFVNQTMFLRMTGESLDYQLTKEKSKEIRSDRQKADLILLAAMAQGGVNFELSFKEFDYLLAGMMQNLWTVYGHRGVGAVFTGTFSAGNVLTASVAPTGASDFTTLQKGQWVQIQGSTITANNGLWQLSTTTAPTTTVLTFQQAGIFTNGSGGAACLISASRLTNGTTQMSTSLEKEFNDIAQFLTYIGMTHSKMAIGVKVGAIIGGNMDFMGKSATRNVTTQLPGAAAASAAFDIMNPVSGVTAIYEGGSLLAGTSAQEISFSTNNGLRNQMAIGSLGPVGLGAGVADMAGRFVVYFANGTLYDKFIANTQTSISFAIQDAAGNGYVVGFPKMRYSDTKVVAGAIDQDVMLEMSFEALGDVGNAVAALQKTIIIDRVGVAV